MKNAMLFKGLSVGGGTLVAPIVILDGSRLNIDSCDVAGKIAVIRIAAPAIVLWLNTVAGLVVETGGVTSHGAILAREFNIPCIVGVSGVFNSSLNGMMGKLDCVQGVLEVYNENE